MCAAIWTIIFYFLFGPIFLKSKLSDAQDIVRKTITFNWKLCPLLGVQLFTKKSVELVQGINKKV